MVSFDDDVDPTAGSGEEDEDEEMEDVNEPNDEQDQDNDQDNDQDQDDDANGDDDDDDNDDDNDNDEDDDGDQDEPDTPSRRAGHLQPQRRSSQDDRPPNPAVVLTSPSPRAARSPAGPIVAPYIPPVRPEALSAQAYDIVPTMAAPQSTSINAIAATPDMRWVFSGGTDGYIRMYNWMETANGKVPLTVAQKHPFVDSVMKAGSLLTYWENEEPQVRTPPAHTDDSKWVSPVYSLAVQHQAVWLLSGLESGGINLQTCRHQAGTRITTLKEHTSAVSVLSLSQDEQSLLSGSWDKNIHDWDLNNGKVKRTFKGSGMQISAIEPRPLSDVPIPEVVPAAPEQTNGITNGSATFSSNNADPFTNGLGGLSNGFSHQDSNGEADAAGSPAGSPYDDDHGSLFGEDNEPNNSATNGGNVFGDDDDDELSRALANEMQGNDEDAIGETDNDIPATANTDATMTGMEADANAQGMGSGGPVQPPAAAAESSPPNTAPHPEQPAESQQQSADSPQPLTNGHAQPPSQPTSPPSATATTAAPSTLTPAPESQFLSTSIDGVIRLWDKRTPQAIATITPSQGTPPWATGACWSPDGNFFYAGRRNCSVDEYSMHHLGSKRNEPARTFKFQQGSGAVYAVRCMPNSRHLVCASNDILRIYDLSLSDAARHRSVPFTIVPGHRGGVISAVHLDPSCRFMLSAAGNRGWEGGGTEVLLGYEVGCW